MGLVLVPSELVLALTVVVGRALVGLRRIDRSRDEGSARAPFCSYSILQYFVQYSILQSLAWRGTREDSGQVSQASDGACACALGAR